jgi:hypothetical protein
MEDSTFVTLNPEDDISKFNSTTFDEYTELLASQLADAALAFAGLDTQNVSDSSSDEIMAQHLAGTIIPFANENTSSIFETSSMELAMRLTGAILLILLSLVGGFVNAAVLMVFVRRPALRNRSNR